MIILVLVATTAPLLTLNAQAHAVLEPGQAAVGAPYRAAIKIGHGCEGSPTVKIRVEMPEGVIGVKPMPKPGWTIELARGPYTRSYNFFHGAQLAEGVKSITWSGKLPDDYYDEFVFAAFISDAFEPGQAIYFPTYQDCEKGAYRWIETPAAGQDGHALKSPAPMLMLAASKEAGPTYKLGSLTISAPWARATPGGAKVGGGYVKITNTGSEPDQLIGGTVAGASAVEVHEMAMSDGVMKMRALPDGVEIAPGKTVELKPGATHLMFTGLSQGLTAGKPVKGTLVFKKAGTIEIEYRVAPIGAKSGGGGGEHSHH
jgi:uncharacterized protein YcnI